VSPTPVPPGPGGRERLTQAPQALKGNTNMSAKALPAWNFELAPKPAVAPGQPAPPRLAAEVQFRDDLWREYRREAVQAGFAPAQAAEYASALIPELGRDAGPSEIAPARRDWYYQSRTRVVNRTITSGLITHARWEQSKATWRVAAASASLLARKFRWWNAGRKS
jgi:hypothetical protein